MTYEIGQARVDAVLDKLYPYKDTLKVSPTSDCIAIYSRFPILSHERIVYPSRGNLSGAFELKIGRDTVIVVNNHLETTSWWTSSEKPRPSGLFRPMPWPDM